MRSWLIVVQEPVSRIRHLLIADEGIATKDFNRFLGFDVTKARFDCEAYAGGHRIDVDHQGNVPPMHGRPRISECDRRCGDSVP